MVLVAGVGARIVALQFPNKSNYCLRIRSQCSLFSVYIASDPCIRFGEACSFYYSNMQIVVKNTYMSREVRRKSPKKLETPTKSNRKHFSYDDFVPCFSELDIRDSYGETTTSPPNRASRRRRIYYVNREWDGFGLDIKVDKFFRKHKQTKRRPVDIFGVPTILRFFFFVVVVILFIFYSLVSIDDSSHAHADITRNSSRVQIHVFEFVIRPRRGGARQRRRRRQNNIIHKFFTKLTLHF